MVTEKMYNTTLFVVAILLLAMTLLINPTYYMCILVLSVSLCLYTLLTIHAKRSKIIEKNTPNDPYTITEEEEDISNISRLNDQTDLKLYYTIFNSDSIRLKALSQHWFNIAQYVPTTCKQEDLNIRFENIITGKPKSGIIFNTNNAKGPLSSNLGLGDVTESFTIFTTIAFNIPNSEEDTPNIDDIIKLYANNKTNNGLSLSIVNIRKATQANSFIANIQIQIGEENICQIENYDLDNTVPYIISINKSPTNISISIVSNVDSSDHTENISENIKRNEIVINSNGKGLHLSNKAMELNKFPGKIYNLGIYNNDIVQSHLLKLIDHINEQFLRYNVRLQEKQKQINHAEKVIEDMKSCKYDADTCLLCSDITDWTDLKQIISAKKECKDAINAFCSKSENLEHDLCFCWNPAVNETPACLGYKQIYREKLPKDKCDIDKLLADRNSELYSKMKKTNFCDNSSKQQNIKKDIPLVQMIDNTYDMNKNDIEIYNDIVI
jgi:hypothetical protein